MSLAAKVEKEKKDNLHEFASVEQQARKKQKEDSDAKISDKRGPRWTSKADIEFNKWIHTKPKKREEDKIIDKKNVRGQVRKWNWGKHHDRMVLAWNDRVGTRHDSKTCSLAKSTSKGKNDKALKVKVLEGHHTTQRRHRQPLHNL